jgi:NAD/NADP transhydrogenase alpha subunit
VEHIHGDHHGKHDQSCRAGVPGTILVGFQDPLYRRDEIDELRTRGIESVAFEHVPNGSATMDIDALSTTSRIAGDVLVASRVTY